MTSESLILCVDDEPHILNALERFCRSEGFTMIRAASVAEGLLVLEHTPVAVILSDYQMDGTNGLDFLHEIRFRYPLTVGIILSGFIELPILTRAIENGDIFNFLTKPWRREELSLLLRAALKQHRLLAAKEG